MTTANPTGTKGIAYLRISTDQQGHQSQREAIERWLAARSLKISRWVTDTGSRDASYKREGFQRLLKAVEAKHIDWVVVAERDRFGVADAEEWGYFITILRRNNCQLFSVADDKELTSRNDKIEPFMSVISSGRSQDEQKSRSERAHRGWQSKAAMGRPAGGKAPWGFSFVCYTKEGKQKWRLDYETGYYQRVCTFPDGTTARYDGKGNTPARDKFNGDYVVIEPTLDKETIRWVKQVFKWYAEGHSPRLIANKLNDLKVPALYKGFWGGNAIYMILANPAYVLGVPVYNKRANSRFTEVVGGQLKQVTLDGGRAKYSRIRPESEHVKGTANPANAIIAQPLWDTVQKRLAIMRATKKAYRPRSTELYLSGLIICGGCGRRMVSWKQAKAYRCPTHQHDSTKCACNRTRHDTLEKLILRYLEETGQSLGFLYQEPEHCREVLMLEQVSDKLISQYTKKLTALWREAKQSEAKGELIAWTHASLQARKGGLAKDAAAAIRSQLAIKEKEKERLARRIGLVEDEDAAAAIADRIKEVAIEIRNLKAQGTPMKDRLDAMREELRFTLTEVERVREEMATALPLRKKEYIRSLVSEVRVSHKERIMGKLRASVLVGVEIVPVSGAVQGFQIEGVSDDTSAW